MIWSYHIIFTIFYKPLTVHILHSFIQLLIIYIFQVARVKIKILTIYHMHHVNYLILILCLQKERKNRMCSNVLRLNSFMAHSSKIELCSNSNAFFPNTLLLLPSMEHITFLHTFIFMKIQTHFKNFGSYYAFKPWLIKT